MCDSKTKRFLVQQVLELNIISVFTCSKNLVNKNCYTSLLCNKLFFFIVNLWDIIAKNMQNTKIFKKIFEITLKKNKENFNE